MDLVDSQQKQTVTYLVLITADLQERFELIDPAVNHRITEYSRPQAGFVDAETAMKYKVCSYNMVEVQIKEKQIYNSQFFISLLDFLYFEKMSF